MNILDMELKEAQGDVERFMPLLLDADPSRALVMKYMARGRLWYCEDERGPVCVALMMPVSEGAVELMNLSTREDMRRRGIASAMVNAMKRIYAPEFAAMRVGTADGFPETQGFYEKLGFVFTHMDKDFFVRNYDEPVMDGGKMCVDMARYEQKFR